MTDRVAVAFVHPAQVSAYFSMSLLQTLVRDMAGPRRILGHPDAGGVIRKYSSANIAQARNECVRDFLDLTAAEWLWLVDSDMVWTDDALERLLEWADPEKSPVVGALCFTTTNDGGPEVRLAPTLYGWMENPAGGLDFYRYKEYPPDAMFQVGATGAAFLLVHRSVLQAMRDAADEGRPNFSKVFPWFQETELSGKVCGEDVTFCARVGMLGYPVWVHTGIDVGHHKDHVLNVEQFAAQRAAEVAAR